MSLKNCSLLILLGLGSLWSFAGNGYSIKVRIAGLTDSTCLLVNYYGDKQYLKDTGYVDSKGRMEFSRDEPLERGVYCIVMPNRKYFDFIVDEQDFSMETDTADLVGNMKIKGSPDNELFFKYLQFVEVKGKQADSLQKVMAALKVSGDTAAADALKPRLREIDKSVTDYRKDVIAANPESNVSKMFRAMIDPEIPKDLADSLQFVYYKAHYFDNIDFTKDFILRSPLFHKKLDNYFKNLMLQIPDTIIREADYVIAKAVDKEMFHYVLWYLTNTYEKSTLMGMDAVTMHLYEHYYCTGKAFWMDSASLAKICEHWPKVKPLLLGKIAPNLIMYDTLLRKTPLHAVKSPVTILYFWDSDCGHCKTITPKMNDLFQRYKNYGVKIYGVHTQNEVDKWKSFVYQHDLKNWLHVYDPYYDSNFRKTYNIISTPVIYLLDENKKIVAKGLGVDDLSQIINDMLKQKNLPVPPDDINKVKESKDKPH